jgi:dTDP-4-dehydrorhamnose 3,5-epimerase
MAPSYSIRNSNRRISVAGPNTDSIYVFGDGVKLARCLMPRFDQIKLFVPERFEDERGFFSETYNARVFRESVPEAGDFVQDNFSRSRRGVLRGMHYQVDPMPQGKLVRVTRGAVFDVVLDVRRASPTLGEWEGFELSEANAKQLWIPPGFAHGFLALTDPADLLYKVTAYYSRSHERAVRWDDPGVRIDWPLESQPIVSAKDNAAPLLHDAELMEK